jgi:hypothetical protein
MPRREHEHEDGHGHDLPALDQAVSYTIDDACRVTGWAEPRLYDEIRAKRVLSYTLGRRRFISAASLKARVEELLAAAAPIRPEPRFRGCYGRRDGLISPQHGKTKPISNA